MRNVSNWVEGARRLLGRSVLGCSPEARALERGGLIKSAEHCALRAIQHAIVACFSTRQVETPQKHDTLPTILSKLERIE